MGTWGASLYEDDFASDLRNTIKALCKVPGDGDRLLGLLTGMHDDCDTKSDEGALFWLVTADQFERHGIHCKGATTKALKIIEHESDLTNARDKGADEAFLKLRAGVLRELAQRLKSPRPVRPRKIPKTPPPLVLETGEVYAFPTMRGNAWHPYRLASAGPFAPDGWGAMVVLATGRAFDWLPWTALASLTVKPDRKPTLEDALNSRLLFHSQTDGAGRFIPKKPHARGMGLELLGRIKLNPALVQPHLSKWSVAQAIRYDWTIAYGAITTKDKFAPVGCKLSALIRNP